MAEPGGESTVIVVTPAGAPAADVQDAVAQAVKVAFGLCPSASAWRSGRPVRPPPCRAAGPSPVPEAADVLVGTAWGVARVSGRIVATGSRVARPLVSFVGRPPLVPRRFHPAHGVQVMVSRWQRDRPDTVRALDSWTSSTSQARWTRC